MQQMTMNKLKTVHSHTKVIIDASLNSPFDINYKYPS